jgi:hypothetical protein
VITYTNKLYVWSFATFVAIALLFGIAGILTGTSSGVGLIVVIALVCLYATTLIFIIRRHQVAIHVVRICSAVFVLGSSLGLYQSITKSFPIAAILAFVLFLILSVFYFARAGRYIQPTTVSPIPDNP